MGSRTVQVKFCGNFRWLLVLLLCYNVWRLGRNYLTVGIKTK